MGGISDLYILPLIVHPNKGRHGNVHYSDKWDVGLASVKTLFFYLSNLSPLHMEIRGSFIQLITTPLLFAEIPQRSISAPFGTNSSSWRINPDLAQLRFKMNRCHWIGSSLSFVVVGQGFCRSIGYTEWILKETGVGMDGGRSEYQLNYKSCKTTKILLYVYNRLSLSADHEMGSESVQTTTSCGSEKRFSTSTA